MIFNEYNILLTPSNSLFKQTIVCMVSAMHNCVKPINFYIMQSDWTEEQKSFLLEYMKNYTPNSVAFVTVDDNVFKQFDRSYKGRYSVYYKLMAHYYISNNNGFKDIDRIMYLDIDIIVAKDIYDFYSIDLENYYLYAPVHPIFTEYSFEEYEQQNVKGKYPNYAVSGSLIINLDIMRKQKINMDFYLNKINELDYEFDLADESVINIVFWGKIKFFPYYKYNYFLSYYDRYKKAFSYSKQERIEKCNKVYHEDFDEKNFAAIVHFASYMITKPWNTIIDKNNKKVLGYKVSDIFYEYYEMWWSYARKIPLECYEKLLRNAQEIVTSQPINDQLNAVNDVLLFFETLAYDNIAEHKLMKYVQFLKGKKISILKAYDSVSKYFIKILKYNDITILFSTGKPSIAALTLDEWEQCKGADVIINCNVHNPKPMERDGIKPVMIWDILNNDLFVQKEIKSEYELSIKKLFNEIYETKSEYELSIKKLFNEIYETKSEYELSIKKLFNEIYETKSELNRANTEITEKMCCISEQLSDINNIRIEKNTLENANKELCEEKIKLTVERDALKENINDLKAKYDLLNAEKTAYTTEYKYQIQKITDELNKAVVQGETLKKQTEMQENEIKALTQQLQDIKASRSWKITKPLRSFKAIFTKKKG